MITEEYFNGYTAEDGKAVAGVFFAEASRLQKECGDSAIITAIFHLISKETINVPMVLDENGKAKWVMKPSVSSGAVILQMPNVDNTSPTTTAREITTSNYRKVHIALERIAYVELTASKTTEGERKNPQTTQE